MTTTTTNNECPWLTRTPMGYITIEGRARLPEGYNRPAELAGLAVTWRFDPAGWLWRFRAEGHGDALAIQNAFETAWLVGVPMRFDRATLEAAPRLETFEALPEGGEVEVDDQGEPVAVTWLDEDATEAELAEMASGAKRVFGEVMTLAPWERIAGGWRAPVVSFLDDRAVG